MPSMICTGFVHNQMHWQVLVDIHDLHSAAYPVDVPRREEVGHGRMAPLSVAAPLSARTSPPWTVSLALFPRTKKAASLRLSVVNCVAGPNRPQ